jgi:hypothetical protein
VAPIGIGGAPSLEHPRMDDEVEFSWPEGDGARQDLRATFPGRRGARKLRGGLCRAMEYSGQ